MSNLNFDCLVRIFENLEGDYRSLYSCAVVNKLWCQCAIPELWKNPWQIESYVLCAILKIYLSKFPRKSKELLLKNDLKIFNVHDSPTFNYISFLRILKISCLEKSIQLLLKRERISADHLPLLLREFVKEIFTKSRCIYVLHVNSTYQASEILIHAMETIPEAKTCLSTVSDFKCAKSGSGGERLYPILSTILHNIKRLYIENAKITKDLSMLINSQRKLQIINIKQYHERKPNSDENQVCSLHVKNSSSVTQLEYEAYCFSMQLLPKFENLKKLMVKFEGIEFTRDEYEPLFMTSFKKLEIFSWICSHKIYLDIFARFVLLNGQNLRHITLRARNDGNSRLLLDSITITCFNLQSYDGPIARDSVKEFSKLLETCKQLKSLRLYPTKLLIKTSNIDDLLDVITKISPTSLMELRLMDSWKMSLKPFEDFLKSREMIEKPIKFHYNPGIMNSHDFHQVCTKYQRKKILDFNMGGSYFD
ncbi:17506_t:CDS:1 [Funneliformis caledonium]|uniref:17506_t:CDS:1 n=1 Tax=Funneliformis caledonium TaxID=1117310 RepID=A0A9N9DSM9_9GLOM|nr:17506_t:CDS:1 [Funneliformis caledonium]